MRRPACSVGISSPFSMRTSCALSCWFMALLAGTFLAFVADLTVLFRLFAIYVVIIQLATI